jgi:hypothetical protein
MATTHRILDDLLEESFSLFAIHSTLEDYAVVYALNQYLKARFQRLRTDLDIDRGISFPIFEWRDVINDRYWTLISNYCRKAEAGKTSELFINEPSFTTYNLIPEYRDVDYFLKLEGEPEEEEDAILKSLTQIPKLITAYAIDTNKLKSKKNLIF